MPGERTLQPKLVPRDYGQSTARYSSTTCFLGRYVPVRSVQITCQMVYPLPHSLEVRVWSHAADSLRSLSGIYANSKIVETMGRVNRLISTWPTDDTVPAQGLGYLQGDVQGKLTSGLTEIMNSASQEAE